LRGGLEERSAEPEAADWASFCSQIGWQTTRHPLADDYEDRLVDRILGEQGSPAEPARFAADASWSSTVVEHGGPASTRRPRRAASGSVALLAAAILGAAAAAAVPWVTGTQIAAAPRIDREMPAVVPALLHRDGRELVEPADVPRDPEPEEDLPHETGPNEASPDLATTPPGSPIARRSNKPARARAAPRAAAPSLNDDVAETTLAFDAPRGVPGFERSGSRWGLGSMTNSSFSIQPAAAITFPTRVAAPGGAWPEAAHAEAGLGGTLPAVARGGEPEAASDWSLSDEGERWYGATLPPAVEPASARAGGGIGVMAQVDVTKAFASLEPARRRSRR
jgi:hypothetical protein